jgi:hypothetical protein
MTVPKIKPASPNPGVISEFEFSDDTRTIQYPFFVAFTLISFFCIITSQRFYQSHIMGEVSTRYAFSLPRKGS